MDIRQLSPFSKKALLVLDDHVREEPIFDIKLPQRAIFIAFKRKFSRQGVTTKESDPNYALPLQFKLHERRSVLMDISVTGASCLIYSLSEECAGIRVHIDTLPAGQEVTSAVLSERRIAQCA